eukprot:gene8534-9407_t
MPPKTTSKSSNANNASTDGDINISVTIVKRIALPASPAEVPAVDPAAAPPPSPPISVEGYRIRTFSSWSACAATSPIFGDPNTLCWSLPPENTSSTQTRATFMIPCDAQNLNDGEAVKSFHANPFLFFTVYYVTWAGVSLRQFLAMDCSALLVDSSPLRLTRLLDKDHEVEIVVTAKKAFLSWEKVLPWQPLVFHWQFLGDYPVYEEEQEGQAVQGLYLHATLPVVPGLVRPVLLFPSSPPNAEGKRQARWPLEQKVILLPGLGDASQLRDVLSSTTFSVELFQDDWLERALPSALWGQYCQLVQQEPGGLQLPEPPPAAAPPAGGAEPAGKGGKKGAAAKAPPPAKTAAAAAAGEGAGKPLVYAQGQSAMLPSDQLLFEAIQKAWKEGRQLRPHGSARFRLEALLDPAADLQHLFARKRLSDEERKAAVEEEEVVVKMETSDIEVRLEKPSRPSRWDLPSDLSLLSALQRTKQRQQQPPQPQEEEGSQQKGKQATQGVGRKWTRPRHELFLENQTFLRFSCEWHRKFDPQVKQLDSAVEVPINKRGDRHAKGEGDASLDKPVQPVKPASPRRRGAVSKGPSRAGSPAGTPSSRKASKAPLPRTDAEVDALLKERPFTRLLLLMRYDNDDLLRTLNDGLNALNHRALPDIQGTVRSYSLTAKEHEAAERGELDLLSGFMVLDNDQRLVVLEGKAAADGAMEALYMDYLYPWKEDKEVVMLCNPQVLFATRAYPDFLPDLRRIRIRGSLAHLASQAEIYNRQQVEELAFQAVDALLSLKRCQDLRAAKLFDIFPTQPALLKLELLYGEAISRADMDGTLKIEFLERHEDHNIFLQQRRTRGTSSSPPSPSSHSEGSTSSRSAWVPTDCRNEAFEEVLRERKKNGGCTTDFLAPHRLLRRQLWQDMLRRREEEEEEAAVNPQPQVYLYSQQRENTKEKLWKDWRGRVAGDHSAVYTFSAAFLSQSVSPVDDEEEKKKELQASQTAWMTQKGFQYPKPRTRAELLALPQRPSPARVEDLKEPFQDDSDRKKTLQGTTDPKLASREKSFHSQTKAKGMFGALEPPRFEHEFQLRLIGDRQTLPRGQLVEGGHEDPNFFRSVHLGGDEQARLIAEAKKEEERKWRELVVVDTLDFKVGQMKVRDRPIQVDRTSDILHDEAKTAALKHLREMKSSRGANWNYTTAPLSLMSREPYAQNAAANALMRTTEPSKFVTIARMNLQASALAGQEQAATNAASSSSSSFLPFQASNNTDGTGKKAVTYKTVPRNLDFETHVQTKASFVAKRKHPPLERSSPECTGPKWQPPNN